MLRKLLAVENIQGPHSFSNYLNVIQVLHQMPEIQMKENPVLKRLVV